MIRGRYYEEIVLTHIHQGKVFIICVPGSTAPENNEIASMAIETRGSPGFTKCPYTRYMIIDPGYLSDREISHSS